MKQFKTKVLLSNFPGFPIVKIGSIFKQVGRRTVYCEEVNLGIDIKHAETYPKWFKEIQKYSKIKK